MKGWAEGTGPWEPVIKDDKLYGRGGADDGYAMFAALAALLALQEQGIAHARCVIVIEACEESGSPDLPFYIDHLATASARPILVVCLDSGCGNYDQLWLTTSLRGIVIGNLTVRVLTEGVHSGDASGIVPSSFRIARRCCRASRTKTTGEIKLDELFVQVPPGRIAEAKQAADILGDAVYSKLPFCRRDQADERRSRRARCSIAPGGRNWRSPAWTAIRCRRMAAMCCLPYTTAKLSLRLPPTCDADKATTAIKTDAGSQSALWRAGRVRRRGRRGRLERARPGAVAGGVAEQGQQRGISASRSPSWAKAARSPSWRCWAEHYPKTQFVVTGVLGPHSNAHGPNEFLHIPTAKKVSACIADVLADHAAQ